MSNNNLESPISSVIERTIGAHADAQEPGSDLANRSAENPGPGALNVERVMDIPVQLTVQLGRVKIPIKQILQLAQGSVIELNAMAGDPMDVLVNGYLIAQGEVVVVNEKYGIRLTDIVTPAERLRRVSGE